MMLVTQSGGTGLVMGEPGGGSPPGGVYDVVRVGPPFGAGVGVNKLLPGSAAKLLEAAAARLVAVSSTEKGSGKRFLDSAKHNGVDLTHFYASVNRVKGNVREVCLAVPGSGGTAMFFTSNPGAEVAQAELAEVIGVACSGIAGAGRGVKLAQALLEVDDVGSAKALGLAGFRRLDELIYMRRPRPATGEFVPNVGALPASMSVTTWSPGDDEAIKVALEKSYVGTLDCPELCGMRSTDDVLASHRQTGTWDPRCWWVIREGETPVGAMLFNPCPEQESIELVYFGLDPSLRGKGVAGTLLRIGLNGLVGRAELTVACAVDARNAPARKLYERAGFSEFGRRVAMVRGV
jgi:RimJ/RimL family protein N-acetyltransferase